MMMEEIGIQEAANRELLETWSSLEKEFVEKAVLDAGVQHLLCSRKKIFLTGI